ncbi:hypothetical protein M1567_01555 [Candidatus Marsarchaeota archaeon]|nr:hypothetical protein [Candidatus Marsarchaeota archaeon]
MGFGIIITVLIVAFDFLISMWDAYAGGYSLGMIKKNGDQSKFRKISAYAAVGLGLVGATYVMAIIIGFIAYYLAYISLSTLEFVLSFDFIFLGILIIGFGFIITIQSIIIAAKRRSAGSILIALFNSFIIAFDVYMYVTAFSESLSVIKRTGRRSQGNGLMIVLMAALIAAIIVHAAYKHGYKKALGSAAQQNPGGGRGFRSTGMVEGKG